MRNRCINSIQSGKMKKMPLTDQTNLIHTQNRSRNLIKDFGSKPKIKIKSKENNKRTNLTKIIKKSTSNQTDKTHSGVVKELKIILNNINIINKSNTLKPVEVLNSKIIKPLSVVINKLVTDKLQPVAALKPIVHKKELIVVIERINCNKKEICKNTVNDSTNKGLERYLTVQLNIMKMVPTERCSNTTNEPSRNILCTKKELIVKIKRLNFNIQNSSIVTKTVPVYKSVNTINEVANAKPNLIKKQLQRQCLEHKLRRAEKINYAEDTLGEKVPIYKQIENKPILSSKNKDLYEFDESSPENRGTKRRQNSIIYDKATKTILDKIEQNEKRDRKKIIRKRKKTTYEMKMNAILDEVQKKIAKNKVNDRVQFQISNNETEVALLDDNHTQINIIDKNKVQEPVGINIHNLETEIVVQPEEVEEHDNDNYSIYSVDTEDEMFFGFAKDSPEKRRVNIISDVTLDSPSQFREKRPIANSTFAHSPSKTPWRCQLAVRRNPHLVSLKPSGLPNLEQDMVIDHTVVEKFQSHLTRKTPCISRKASPVQSSLLDYFETDADKENNPPVRVSSLFDYEDFASPLKKSSAVVTAKVQAVKRRILGEMNENSVAAVTVIENTTVIDYFGFEDDDNNCDKENRIDKSARALPSRANLKQYSARNVADRRKKLVTIADVSSTSQECDDSFDDTNRSLPEEEGGAEEVPMKLFDDPEEILDSLPPEIHSRGRKKRCVNFGASGSEEPKKKRKTAKELAEEAAFEKWAAEFNAMCEEVEQHQLEIE